MWSVASKSMIHIEEEEIKHVLVLPNSTSVVIEVDSMSLPRFPWKISDVHVNVKRLV